MKKKKQHTIREENGREQRREISGKQVDEEEHNQTTDNDVAKNYIPASVNDFRNTPAVSYLMKTFLVDKNQPKEKEDQEADTPGN